MGPLEYRALTTEEIEEGLRTVDGWTVDGAALVKAFTFPAYKDGLAFAVAVGFLADRLDHHPDLAIGYRRVEVRTTTHATEGLSPYDFELAQRIDSLGG